MAMPQPHAPQNGHMPYKSDPALSSWAFETMNGSTRTNPWPAQQQWGLLNGGLPSEDHSNNTQPQSQMPTGNNGVNANGNTDDGFGEFAAADHGSMTHVKQVQASGNKADFSADRLVACFQCMPCRCHSLSVSQGAELSLRETCFLTMALPGGTGLEPLMLHLVLSNLHC